MGRIQAGMGKRGRGKRIHHGGTEDTERNTESRGVTGRVGGAEAPPLVEPDVRFSRIRLS